jgi:hypothetical protein
MTDSDPSSPAARESLDGLCRRIAAGNPFLDNRVAVPTAQTVDVPEVHAPAFERLLELSREAHTARRGVGVVLWGEAGIGKSHLLARLGRWAAAGNATLAYLHNLQAAPEHLPRSLLHTVLSILTEGRGSAFQRTPLYELVRAGLLEAVGHQAGFLPWPQVEMAYHVWVDRLARSGLAGGPIDRLVYEVLFAFFRSAIRAGQGKEDGGGAALAVRWLGGQALDPVEARYLGLPPGRRRDDPAALEDPQQYKQVLVALTCLAAARGLPFVLAFDQCDNLEAEQFAALARFLEALIDSSPNLLVVTAGIQSTLMGWQQQRVVQDSAWDRLAQFEVQLPRLSAAEAVRLVRARLDGFLAPAAELEPIARLRSADPLFPLGEPWRQRFLGSRPDVRPRDVINWAREGWRRQQEELARLGGPAWLVSWPEQGATGTGDDKEEPKWTAEQEQEAIDRKVEDLLSEHRQTRRLEPGGLPADADHLVAVLYDLLAQCRDVDRQHGLLEVERLPAPRRGARPTYDLALRQQPPTSAEDPPRSTGVVIVTAGNATSVAGFLRRLVEDARPLDRVVLVTDERTGLPLGERGREYLEALQRRGAEQFRTYELTFNEYTDLEALQSAVRAARGGDVEIEPTPGRSRAVSPEEVVASHLRRRRYLASPLLRVLLSAEVEEEALGWADEDSPSDPTPSAEALTP